MAMDGIITFPGAVTCESRKATHLDHTEALHRAVHAARRALSDASADASEVDVIIYIASFRQFPPRWQSARVAHALNTRDDVVAFDVPGAQAALRMASAIKETDKSVRRVLVIDAEEKARPSAVLLQA
ncbi:hypothetical protein AB0H73_28055 [Streptomyces olivoreticuli]